MKSYISKYSVTLTTEWLPGYSGDSGYEKLILVLEDVIA